MSELVNKLYTAMGSWKAVGDLIDEIRRGNLTFERSSVSTIRARLDNGIYNHYTGGLNDVYVEVYRQDNCGVVIVDSGIVTERIQFRGGTLVYNQILEYYKHYEAAEERTAKSFFCVWDDSTESYLD